MKVLHLVKTSKGALWAFNFMKDLKKKKPDIEFYAVVSKGGDLYNKYFDFCEQVFEFNFEFNSIFFSKGKELKKIVKEIEPDIIHSWFTQTTLYARFFLRNYPCPRIFQVVGPLHLESKLYKYADVYSANKYDYWVATSQYIYDKYRNTGVAEKRLFLNYAYIDTNDLLETNIQIEPINYIKKYNLPKDSKIIGTASYIYAPKRFRKYGVKGHEYLILAFAELLKLRKDVYLIIAGEPFLNNSKYLEKLKEMAAKYCKGKVLFTGRYENIYKTIGAMDVFVYLSLSENLGGVYESLLFKVPTVASKRGGIPELVKNKSTGYIVNPDDSTEVSSAINSLLENPETLKLFKQNGQEKVLNIFDKQKILNKGLMIYKELLYNK